MMKFAILLLIGVIARQAYADEPEAIIGGQNAVDGQFPYQVSLQNWRGHFCGGTLISESYIITAAHCIPANENEWKYITVATGTIWSINNSGERHEIKHIRVHPGYTGDLDNGLPHDIAVIILATPAKTSKLQSPIRLATKDYSIGKTAELRGLISGWGKTSLQSGASARLKWVSVNILSQRECLKAHYPSTYEEHICTLETVGKGACQGDSGGPLVINGELVGVVSWAIPCAVGEPDVFTNVYHYLDFIKETFDMYS